MNKSEQLWCDTDMFVYQIDKGSTVFISFMSA